MVGNSCEMRYLAKNRLDGNNFFDTKQKFVGKIGEPIKTLDDGT